jgi:ribosomal protein S18 acetylase RimI-like enzyme
VTSGFHILDDPRDPRFEPLIVLYEAAIPARERKPEEAVRAMATSPVHRVGILAEGSALLGFFLLYVGESLALLEYLAVHAQRRSAGLGASLYAHARASAAGLPLLVEVDSDREAAPDRALRARRIAFYRRLGCRRLKGLDFILPLPGDGAPPELDLLVDGVEGRRVDADCAALWLGEIYVGVYGCGGDDPRLRAMIARLPNVVELG